MLKLQVKDNRQRAVWLVEPGVVIGSDAACQMVLNSEGILGRHAEIRVNNETLTVFPLSSKARVSLNQRMLSGPATLALGDELQLGAQLLTVVDPKLERKPVLTAVTVKPADSAPAEIPAETAWSLKANHIALANRVYPLRVENLVGRSSECDIKLASSHLSRQHARLYVRNNQLYVKDLDSANGTFLNGSRITEARLKRGDELRFDNLRFGVLGPEEELHKTSIRLLPAAVAATPQPIATKSARGPVTRVKIDRQKTAQVADSLSSEQVAHRYVPLLVLTLIAGLGMSVFAYYFI